ncbi:MAG TPA: ABC transporter ATP-binding protein [Candidatus Babeliales bacterium]|nr:ABC transporter ATP-binding protein [Candidatus Babeliales bacterium]
MPPFARFVRYARPHRLTIITASICTALSTIFDLLPDILIGVAVDVVSRQENSLLSRFGIIDVKVQLLMLGGAACIIWALEAIFEYLYAYLWRNLAQTLQHELRLKAFEHVQKLGMAYYEDAATGNLLSVLNDDINQLERFLDVGIYKFIYLATTTLAIGSIFFYLAPKIALFAFIPVPIIIFMIFYFKRQLAPRYADVRKRVAQLATRIANTIMGIATIKSYTGEKHELDKLRIDSATYKDANRSAIVISAAFTPAVRMVIVVAFVSTVILGGWQVIGGLLDIGAYSVLVFQTQRLLWPVTDLSELIDLFERAMASVQRIFDLLDTPIETVDGEHSLAMETVKGNIQFNEVSFAYPQGAQVFNKLSFAIEPGSTIAFVGPTGSGKSTLVKLLLRFYDPKSGSITLDGTDIKTVHMHDLRKAISLVSQDVFLFHGTVRENIAYGTFDAPLDEIVNAAQIAQAHEFIMQMPQGYDTVIGERGQKLSGGQRQRLSIARAILKNSPIFIFDEATSAVDNETEAAIQRSLDMIMTKHTVIIIAHRLSTICNVDTIFVLGNGAILESGTHEQLLEKGGMYNALWQVQTGAGIHMHKQLPVISPQLDLQS